MWPSSGTIEIELKYRKAFVGITKTRATGVGCRVTKTRVMDSGKQILPEF